METKTEEAQRGLDALRARIESLDKEVGGLKARFEQMQGEAGAALLNGEDTGEVEAEIFKTGSRLKILESAHEAATKLLQEAGQKVSAAKKLDAEVRVKAIAEEMDGLTAPLRDVLRAVPAKRFDELRQEAFRLNSTEGASLTQLGGFLNAGPPGKNTLEYVVSQVREFLGKK